jgi:hypothetical protein
LEFYPLVVADFASEYGIRLALLNDADMTWREFWTLTCGLLTADTRLYRKFRPERKG